MTCRKTVTKEEYLLWKPLEQAIRSSSKKVFITDGYTRTLIEDIHLYYDYGIFSVVLTTVVPGLTVFLE